MATIEEARRHIAECEEAYRMIGNAGIPARVVVIEPLIRRLAGGETSQELIDEIMAVE